MIITEKPKIGISRCLLGDNVRYNGGHKLDDYIKNVLGKFVEFIPFCPEVEAGFGVPREAVHLNKIENEIFMIGEKTGTDYTNRMNSYLSRKIPDLLNQNLCGYILKSKSPSCGIYRTRVYSENEAPNINGRGLFAEALLNSNCNLLVEEEGRLHNPEIRENFIGRIFINFRWNAFIKEFSVNNFMLFHQSIKYTLMAHSPSNLKEMGKIVANTNPDLLHSSVKDYKILLDKTLKILTDRKKNRNVLDHIMGYFKNDLSSGEKEELKILFDRYYNGLLPIIVPITMLNHYVNKYNNEYLKGQFYLNPHPMELMLLNHV